MRARLTRLTCLSPGLAGLACPLCRSFGWPLLVHRDPCMQHRGHRRKAAREPMAIHSCVHLLWVHPLRYHLLELLLSFSFSILPPTLLLFIVLHCLLLLLFLLYTNNQRQRWRKKNKLILTFRILHTLNVNPGLWSARSLGWGFWHPHSAGNMNLLTSESRNCGDLRPES